jgi:hypothetical protein
MPVKGAYLALAGGGALLVWSGLRGKSWSTVLRDITQGRKPQTATTAYEIHGSTGSAGGINSAGTPVPPHSGIWNTATLRALWISAGGPPATARNAACHAMQESSGNASITSGNPDGGTNVGLWQLDTRGVGAGYSVSQLQNPFTNARLTVRATRGGADWSQWATPGC